MSDNAFPTLESEFNPDRDAYVYRLTGGATLRDYFAARAMAAVMDWGDSTISPARMDEQVVRYHLEANAMLAYMQADAMLKMRQA